MGDLARTARSASIIAPLGVVFGDIGTSPLYAATTTLSAGGARVGADAPVVYGATSAIVWVLTLVVTVLYVRILLRTDNRGEGGLLALFGRLRSRLRGRGLVIFTLIAMLGAGMFVGDSVITPAISVLSAVEGLKVIAPSLGGIVVPASVVILAGVFLVQRLGSRVIGRCFGPVMMLWFVVLAVLGIVPVVQSPAVLQALSPHWAVLFFVEHPAIAFAALGGAVLAVTGAEALYADLGHFGRRSITRAWLLVVYPALLLDYLGQAAVTLRGHGGTAPSFFALVPSWGLIPLVVLATLATIIASQAVISGTFSVAHQAAGLGFLPPLRLIHTSKDRFGQIYIPAVDLLMAVATLAVTIVFRSSAALSSAYGIAVTLTITLTTVILIADCRLERGRLGVRGIVASGILLLVLLILTANTTKIPHGGWLPLAIGALIFVITVIWWTGRRRLRLAMRDEQVPLARVGELIARPEVRVRRVPGDAVFVAGQVALVPAALASLVGRVHVLPRRSVILSWEVTDAPTTHGDADRMRSARLARGVTHIAVRLGFRDRPKVVALLGEAVAELGDGLADFDVDGATYFVSDPVPRARRGGGMPLWAQRVYLALDRIAPDTVDLIDLPRDRTVVIGQEVPL